MEIIKHLNIYVKAIVQMCPQVADQAPTPCTRIAIVSGHDWWTANGYQNMNNRVKSSNGKHLIVFFCVCVYFAFQFCKSQMPNNSNNK